MSPSRCRAKKPAKNIGEEKFTNTENKQHPPVPSITPLFNLLALRNKHLYLKICLFILVLVMCHLFPKGGNDIFEIE